MKNLIEYWDKIEEAWAGKNIILFLDYDGTLTPIVQDPSEAIIPEENKKLIELLVEIPMYQLVIISGRTLVDLKGMVGVKGALYIGNHGWEMDASSLHFENLVSVDTVSIIQRIKDQLMTQLSQVRGVFVEDKKIGLVVHYRLVGRDKELLVRRIFDDVCMPFRRTNQIKVIEGKKVLEIRPPVEWDKGKAALLCLRKQENLKGKGNVLPIYIGDDTTDEDAFRALRNKGITVFVGQPIFSQAQYYLEDPQEVTELLRHMICSVYEKL